MELARSTSRGGFFVRSIFTFVLTVLITAFLWVAFSGQTVHAASDANWKGESIMYSGHQYYAAPDAKAGESHGLAQGTHYYMYVETVSQQPFKQKAHVIYFAPGSDPPKTTTATYLTYDFANKQFSNPSASKSISIDKRGAADEATTSCAIQGVGWIVCSVSVFLAQGMDWVFSILSGFIAVQPPKTGDTHGDLYIAWNIMRSIANVAFIIVFMIIIYSQLTGLGVTNYGLKKLIPRLIVAAVLVNLSYFICAIAIDLSNVVGYSLQDVFVQIRNNVFNVDNDTWTADVISWESITGFVLSGGTATAALGVGATIAFLGIAGGSVVSLIFLLLPALLALLIAILVVIVILAARQAIIVLLLIVSPLAFVAYLLPNTEKWFDKWRELFMTMLIFFPAFSLVFGGSQLAGAVIIQNASNITVMILGMIVQVAPLVITPLLLKLSGTLLARIGSIINDPRKGILDRTRNWANANAAYHAQRVRNGQRLNGAPINPSDPGRLRRRNFVRKAARNFNELNRRLEDRTKAANSLGENVYHRSPAYERIHENQALFDTQKDVIENEHTAHVQSLMTTDGTPLHTQAGLLETRKVKVDRSNEKLAKMNAEIRVGRYATNDVMINAAQADMKSISIETALLKQRTLEAQYELQREVSKELGKKTSSYVRNIKGIGGRSGNVRVRASALAAVDKLDAESRQNTTAMMEFDADKAGMTIKDFTGDIVRALRSPDPVIRARAKRKYNIDEIEAAYEVQAKDGQVAEFDEARASEFIDQKILDRVIARNTDIFKTKGGYHTQAKPGLSLQRYLAAFHKGDLQYGATEQDVRNRFIRDQSREQLDSLSTTPATQLGSIKFGAYDSVAKNFGTMLQYMDINDPTDRATLERIHDSLRLALTDDTMYGSMIDRIPQTHMMEEILSRQVFNKTPIDPR